MDRQMDRSVSRSRFECGENEDEDGWTDVGHGTVGWPELMAALRKTPAKHYVLEHDNPKDLDRLLSRSMASFQTY